MRKMQFICATFFLLESLCLVWAGWSLCVLYRMAGGSLAQALSVGETQWSTALLYGIMAALYFLVPRLRVFLTVIGVLAGIYGAAYISQSSHLLLGSLNPLHGNIIALSVWSEIIMVLLGVVCTLELILLARSRTFVT